ncbi:hypothetical protein [Streptomyces sp. NPDC002324]
MPALAVAMLAGLIVSLTTPQRASAAVDDYKPVTYNMQGGGGAGGSKWQTDVMQLMSAGYNVIALQEAGPRPPASAGNPAWESGYLGGNNQWRGWRVQRYNWDPWPRRLNLPWYIYWLRTDFGGNRVNLAIVTAQPANRVMVAPPAFWGNNGLPTSRPALGLQMGPNTVFFSVHALASGGNDGRQLLQNIATQAGTRTWAAMGDWNREPANLISRPGWHKYTSGRATHISPSGTNRELDYMVSNSLMAGYGGVGRGFGSDHLAVLFGRLAANASVELLNAHDRNANLTTANTLSGTAVITGRRGTNSTWKFRPRGGGLYQIVQKSSNKCMSDGGNKMILWDCDDGIDQKFDIDYWRDTGQLKIKPAGESGTCLGDDTHDGFFTEVLPTMNCGKGEARFNFRFDYDPGPNAPLVVF